LRPGRPVAVRRIFGCRCDVRADSTALQHLRSERLADRPLVYGERAGGRCAAGMAAGREARAVDHCRRRGRLTEGESMPRYPRIVRARAAALLAALGAALGLSGAGPPAADGGSAFTPEDLVMLKRVTDPQVSPDGQRVAFVQRETDMDANKGRTRLWLLELGPDAGAPRRLTDAGSSDSSPRWAPDGQSLYFISTRAAGSHRWGLGRPRPR